MKKILLILSIIPSILFAQEKITITDFFDDDKYQWEESYEDDATAIILDGYYEIDGKKDSLIVQTDLPFNGELNYNLSAKILVPKLGDKTVFGLVFNYETKDSYYILKLSEMKFKALKKTERSPKYSEIKSDEIILKAGKDKEVLIELKKTGRKMKFIVDNMEIATIPFTPEDNKYTSSIGFFVGKSTKIKVDEVKVEQITYNR